MTEQEMKTLNNLPEKPNEPLSLTNREEEALNLVVQLVCDLEALDNDLMAIALVMRLDLQGVMNIKREYLKLFDETI